MGLPWNEDLGQPDKSETSILYYTLDLKLPCHLSRFTELEHNACSRWRTSALQPELQLLPTFHRKMSGGLGERTTTVRRSTKSYSCWVQGLRSGVYLGFWVSGFRVFVLGSLFWLWWQDQAPDAFASPTQGPDRSLSSAVAAQTLNPVQQTLKTLNTLNTLNPKPQK